MKKLFLGLVFSSATVVSLFGNTNGYMHSFHVFPLSFLSGSLAMNYELLLFHQHGVVVEFNLKVFEMPYSQYSIQYRYHFSRRMDSFFIGAFSKYSYLQYNYYNIESRTNCQHWNHSMAFGLNIGYKWVFQNGISLCARIGAGYPIYLEDQPEDQLDVLDSIINIIDSEMTVGYSF